MRSSTRLDSAVFQLTPTRTRCELVITANGRTEKIASGLVNPFLAHLKAAHDQMAKGGYSIVLEPEPETDSSWFTRGTIERFVRFVSTPEILERVYTLESEILQIEEAIAFQNNSNDSGLETGEDHHVKPPERIEGTKPLQETNEKAIVLYQPDSYPAGSNGSTAQEENSKVELMKVLETRRSVLQKEQGMAFARAVAAGFDIDHMPPLVSFAETFGASRLLDACMKFKDLWKSKHESGRWVEIEAAEAMANKSNFGAMNETGIVFSNSKWPGTPESNGKTAAESSADEKSPTDQQPSVSNQEYFQGQFLHPMYPPWPIQSPPGTMPVFPGYPMQFPYYQNYPGNGPFFSPPYPPDASQRKGETSNDVELGENRETRRNSSRPSKKNSAKVVVRNINYITSKRLESSGSESKSASDSETDEEDRRMSSRRSPKKKEINGGELVLYDNEVTNRNETDGGNWEAFQSYLLEDAEKDVRLKRRQQKAGEDPLLLEGQMAQSDEIDGQMDVQSEFNGRRARQRSGNDEFMTHRQDNDSDYMSTDPMAVNGFVHPRKDLQKNVDDSYVVSLRGTSMDLVGVSERLTIEMDTKILSSQQENLGKRVASEVKYEPDDFSLVPERDTENGLVGYDPVLNYEAENGVPLVKKNKEAVATGAKQGSKKVDKNGKSRLVSVSSKGKPSKLSPLEDAKARAEKLRNYKAELQKMKKEKEEQERKRLEALKLERQKRISSRGGSIPAMPTSQQTRKQFPAKLSPSPHKSSKFSDSETGSMSPLQRSKAVKLNTTNSAGNRLIRSVSSLAEPKQESSTVTPDTKASMARIRRLSEPKMSSSNSPVTALKPRKTEPVPKPKVQNAPEIKKLSAIVNYDNNKIASLPELKIGTAKRSDLAAGKSAANGSQANTASKGTKPEENGSHNSDGNENPIIDKKVLIQETSGATGHSSNYEVGENAYAALNYTEIQALGTTEIASSAEKEVPVAPSEKPYEPPVVRNSSTEDSSARNSEYGKTLEANISDPSKFKLEKIPEVLDKPQTKESSKGFRRLLKFGKKNHSSGDRNGESDNDNASINGFEGDDSGANVAVSSEVDTLKNLIFKDESSSASTTPQKTSRHFSLLSPFRSKTSEKKQST